jgi:hypothetical protein
MTSFGSPSKLEVFQDLIDASGSTGSAVAAFLGKQYLFFAIATGNMDVMISPAYILQEQRFHRLPVLDVRVASAFAVAALAFNYTQGVQNQVITPCLYVAYASLTNTSFVYKYVGSESAISLVQTFLVPFVRGATFVSISSANTRYGSDVVLVSFCGISGCEIFLLSSIRPPFVRNIVTVDAKAVWLLSPSSSKHIIILASFNVNTSSYLWDGSVVDLDQSVAMNLSASGRYLTSSSAAYASFSFIGSQDILFLGANDTQFIYRYNALITKWIPLSSFATPASLS